MSAEESGMGNGPQLLHDLVLLDIGCGRNKKQGFIGLDISRDSNADIIAIASSLPLKGEMVSEINCSHLGEHLCPDEAQQFFDEIFRVLKPGGVARLKIDRDWSKSMLLKKDPGHKYRYSVNEIKNMVQKFSFKKVKQKIYLFDFKLRNKIIVELRK